MPTPATIVGSCTLTLPDGSLTAQGDGVTWSVTRSKSPRYSTMQRSPVSYVYGPTTITGAMRLSDATAFRLAACAPLEIGIEADAPRPDGRGLIRLHGVAIDTLDSSGNCTFTARSIAYGGTSVAPKLETVVVMPRLFGDVGELARAMQE